MITETQFQKEVNNLLWALRLSKGKVSDDALIQIALRAINAMMDNYSHWDLRDYINKTDASDTEIEIARYNKTIAEQQKAINKILE